MRLRGRRVCAAPAGGPRDQRQPIPVYGTTVVVRLPFAVEATTVTSPSASASRILNDDRVSLPGLSFTLTSSPRAVATATVMAASPSLATVTCTQAFGPRHSVTT